MPALGAVRAPPVTAVCCRTQDRAGLRPLSCCSRTRPAGPGSSRAPRTARAPLRSAPSFRAPATRGAPACGSSAPSCQRPGRRTERSPRCEQRERRPRPPTPPQPLTAPNLRHRTSRSVPRSTPPGPACPPTHPSRAQAARSLGLAMPLGCGRWRGQRRFFRGLSALWRGPARPARCRADPSAAPGGGRLAGAGRRSRGPLGVAVSGRSSRLAARQGQGRAGRARGTAGCTGLPRACTPTVISGVNSLRQQRALLRVSQDLQCQENLATNSRGL